MENEDTREFECKMCNEEVTVEVGTWAEYNDMCERCWCAYQGG
jgi:hypothetical protein